MEIKLIHVRSFFRKRILMMIMRTFIFLLCTTVFSFAPENTFSQEKVVINQDQLVTIDRVFEIIKEQTDYKFMYPKKMFKDAPKVQLKKGTIRVDKLLNKSIEIAKFNIVLSADSIIVIKEKVLKTPVSSKIVKILQQSISGTVVDTEGLPLPGVTILVKNTITGTSSDFDGKYTLNLRNIDESTVLVFSYLGFKTQEIVIGSRTNIDVNMVPDLSGLDEVVVIGYGTSKVRDVTGSISNISAESIRTAPMGASAESLIQGKAAGVNVQIQSASPTSPISVIIRGASSLGGTNQPLWVIDGVPQYSQADDGNDFGFLEGDTNNVFYNLNIDDIQSIDILKDASATAIYGSRATNGVIIVTTKKGSYETKPTFEVLTRTGITIADWNDFNYFNRDEFIDFIPRVAANEVLSFDGFLVSRIFLDRPAFLDLNTSEYDANSFVLRPDAFNTESPVTDWLDLLTQSPIVTNHSFSARGGSKNSSYFTSFSYSKTEGVIKGGFSETFGGRLNFDTKFSDNFKFGLNLYGSTREADTKDQIIQIIKQIQPDFPAFNEDGSLYEGNNFTQNPLLELENSTLGENVVFQGTAYLEAKFLNNFSFRTAFSNNYANNETLSYRGIGSSQLDGLGERTLSISKLSVNVWENTLSYKKVFNDKHDVTGLLGFSKEQSNRYRLGLEASDFPDNILNGFGAATTLNTATEAESENALISYFGRGQYQFDNRYIVSGTIRRDGSSRFGSNKRWGTFPSGAIAWVVTGEKFMQSEKTKKSIPFLKLRASFGLTGGQGIGDFDHLSTFRGTSYNGSPAIAPDGLGNRNLQWEETELLDLGIDFSLFDSRLSGTLGKYRKRSRDILFDTDIPTSSSFETVVTNVATLDNDGYEINLNYDLIRSKDHRLTLNVNWATNQTTVQKINGTVDEIIFPDPDDAYQRLVEGGATDEWWGFQTAGRFFETAEDVYSYQTRDEYGEPGYFTSSIEGIGDVIYVDQNGDGMITDDDRVNLGSAAPDGFGGFGLKYSHKNFSIDATFVYAYGNKRLWEQALTDSAAILGLNPSNSITGQSVTEVGTGNATFPRASLFPVYNNALFSDAYLFDASYLRLNQLSVGYSIPKKIFKNSAIEGIDLTLQGTNLFTITKYPGIDPQGNFGLTRVGDGIGVDNSTFPQSQSYSLGVRISLQ
ncbi:MAG: SusC/RagA family TonB-linked outer membrane protein [Algibacter sp.]